MSFSRDSRQADRQGIISSISPHAPQIILSAVTAYLITTLILSLLPPLYQLAGTLVVGGLLIVAASLSSQRDAASLRLKQAASASIVMRGIERFRGHSLHDPETGIYRLWYFELRLDEEIQRCRRYGQPMSILVLKVRPLSTAYQRVDARLHADLAHQAASVLRASDLASCLGEFEYAFCLPQTDAAGAHAAGRRLTTVLQNADCTVGTSTCVDGDVTAKAMLWAARQTSALGPARDAPSLLEKRSTADSKPPRVAPALPVTIFPRVRVLANPLVVGGQIEIEAQVAPFAWCELAYFTPSGRKVAPTASTAPCRADAAGLARWSWRIGSNTRPGTCRIDLSSGGSVVRAVADIVATEEARPLRAVRAAS
jgi:GGDEF domain-containing protein